MKSKLLLALSIIFIFVLVFAFYYFSKPTNLSNDTMSITTLEEDNLQVKTIRALFASIDIQAKASLPPHQWYQVEYNKGKYIVFTTEGSGIEAIFSATCFNYGNSKQLGSYESGPNTRVLTNVSELDPSTCRPLDVPTK